MKKSKKFILAVVVILVTGIVIILAKPSIIETESDQEVTVEVSQKVQETSKELSDEIFD